MSRSGRGRVFLLGALLATLLAGPVAVAAGSDAPVLGGATTGSIAGTVTAADTGLPVRDFCVVAAQGPKVVAATCTRDTGRTDGSYDLVDLAPGTYTVGFTTLVSGFGPTVYAPAWYGGQADESTAVPVSVVAGGRISGIDQALMTGATITGRAIDRRTGRPLARSSRVCVFAVSLTPVTVPRYDENFSDRRLGGQCASTFADGHYRLGGLPAGKYLVHFDSGFDSGRYFSQWYPATSKRHAQRLRVGLGDGYDRINARMEPAGEIAGKVVDAKTGRALGSADCVVAAYDLNEHVVTASTRITHGRFYLSQLTTGVYRVRVLGKPFGYRNLWFDSATSFGGASDVHVTLAKTTTLPSIHVRRR